MEVFGLMILGESFPSLTFRSTKWGPHPALSTSQVYWWPNKIILWKYLVICNMLCKQEEALKICESIIYMRKWWRNGKSTDCESERTWIQILDSPPPAELLWSMFLYFEAQFPHQQNGIIVFLYFMLLWALYQTMSVNNTPSTSVGA